MEQDIKMETLTPEEESTYDIISLDTRPTGEAVNQPENNAKNEEVTETEIDITIQPTPEKDGTRAWLVCFGGFLIQVLIVGFLHVYGIFFVKFLEEFKSSKATTAWVGALAYGVAMALGPLSSAVINRYGNRISAMIGSIICSIALLISSFMPDVTWLFVTLSFLYGCGCCFAYTPTMCISGDYFEKYVALATGIMTAGSSVGTLILSPFTQLLVDSIGWRGAFRVFSGVVLIPLWSSYLFKPLEGSHKTPSQRIKTSLARRVIADLALWKNRVFIVWIAGIFLVMFGYYIPYVHLVSYAMDVGIPPTQASLLMMVMGGATATGRVLFGKIVEYGFLNRLHMHQLSMVVTGTGCMLLPLIRSFSGLVAYVIFIGLVDGCYVVLLPTLTASFVGQDRAVVAWGFLVGVTSVTYTLGPPIAGLIYDSTGSYNLAFHLAGIPLILGALILFLVPWAQRTAKTTNVMVAARKTYEQFPESETDRADDNWLTKEEEEDTGDFLVFENFDDKNEHREEGIDIPTKNSASRDTLVPSSVSKAIDILRKTSRTLFRTNSDPERQSLVSGLQECELEAIRVLFEPSSQDDAQQDDRIEIENIDFSQARQHQKVHAASLSPQMLYHRNLTPVPEEGAAGRRQTALSGTALGPRPSEDSHDKNSLQFALDDNISQSSHSPMASPR
ncbi:monocarboxylate transporter 10 [Lingula anatina]|uniref:Monocarboxylate transporter 10 n=1 Tax=Lingula anatina TaxID=7574 RepID=A0A1S3IV34_LINAN|nr:monocarboxylate transporter 10 [Lingula anatina]|eukprot:XP_013401404.1 monocarboxylate transporter 10 [Lingula anatina]